MMNAKRQRNAELRGILRSYQDCRKGVTTIWPLSKDRSLREWTIHQCEPDYRSRRKIDER